MAKDTKKPTKQAKNAKKQPVNARKTKPQAKKATPMPSGKKKPSTPTKKTTTPAKGKSTAPKTTNRKKDSSIELGTCIMTRDDLFHGQGNKKIHTEIDKKKLYRRTVTTGINKDGELALQKTHLKDKTIYPAIPKDKQKRRYERNLLTQDKDGNAIKVEKGKFEIGKKIDNVTAKQASIMLIETLDSSKRSDKRFSLFKKAKRER